MLGATQTTLSSLIGSLIGIVNSLAWLLSGLALLVFFYGIFLYVYHGAQKGSYKNGKDLMLWGIISLFVIFSLGGILKFISASFLL